jgi:hypothetical protein
MQIFKIVCIQLLLQNCRARVNVDATHRDSCMGSCVPYTLNLVLNLVLKLQYTLNLVLNFPDISKFSTVKVLISVLNLVNLVGTGQPSL